MTRSRPMLSLMLLVLALSPAVEVQAQSPRTGRGVANSGLEQGEVLVAVRSDVRLAIKGLRATLTERLAGLTAAVSSQMPGIRTCYSTLVATRPASVGGLRALIVLDPGSVPASVEITEVDGSDTELTACVGTILRTLDLHAVERPAAAEVALTFNNTRAGGQAQVDASQAAFAVSVERADDGSYVGRWETESADISFVVHVAAADGEALARALVSSVRAGYTGFVDCRRRAGRQGMSPAGEFDLDLRIAGDGKITGHVTRTSVEDRKRTPACVEKAATRLEFQGARGTGRARVTLRFAG